MRWLRLALPLRHGLAGGLSLVLFGAALWLLHREVASTSLADVRQAIGQVSITHVLLALAATACSYCALAGYDWLALRHLKKALPIPVVALTSFVATAVGHNFGAAMISGGAVRMRCYTAEGLTATEVAGLAALIGWTFGVGVTFACAMALMLEPLEASLLLGVPPTAARWAGVGLIMLVAFYLLSCQFRRKPITLSSWQFELPSGPMALGQLALAVVDLGCAAAVLYWLLPMDAGVSFGLFLGVYVLALVAGVISHVPGGFGVFETVMLLGLPQVPRDGLLAAILTYRAVYYLLPLAVAAAITAVSAAKEHQQRWVAQAQRLGAMLTWITPSIVSLSVFFAGAVLLFSGSTPAISARLKVLTSFVPLPVLELSHLTGSMAGLGLLILARALYRRIDAAYHLVFWLLVTGIVASLAKGLDIEEAAFSSVVLLILWLGRSAFNRPSSLFEGGFSASWLSTIAVVLMATIWLGLFSYRHVIYSEDLWWHFAERGDAPRFLRASLLVVLMTAGLALARLLKPPPPEPAYPDAAALDHAARIVADAQDTDASLALMGDKHLLFSEDGEAFIMYAVQGESWIAMGDPVGPVASSAALMWRFREMADRHGGRVVFYQVSATKLHLYLDLGLSAMKLGEEGLVALQGFSLDGPARRDLRQSHRRAERIGLRFEWVEADALRPLLPELKRISDAWLQTKNVREKGFSIGRFDPDYLCRFPCALVRHEGRLVAFANVWRSSQQHELSIDLMRYQPDAPSGIMEFLFVELMLWGAKEGFELFNLGMAPLAGLEHHTLAPLWHRLGTLIYRQGEHFYNFDGLRMYKQKFSPTWRPKYLAAPGGLSLPSILLDVTTLIAGGVKGILKR